VPRTAGVFLHYIVVFVGYKNANLLTVIDKRRGEVAAAGLKHLYGNETSSVLLSCRLLMLTPPPPPPLLLLLLLLLPCRSLL